MQSIPIFLSAEHQHVLIVGATAAAMAKLALLAESAVRITLIDPDATKAASAAGLTSENLTSENLASAKQAPLTLELIDRSAQEDDVKGKTLVYVASDDGLVEERLIRAARERGVPLNVVDKPAKSSFITPAQFHRGPLKVAFSSGGVAPVFVRRLRSLLETIVPASLGTLASAAGRAKTGVKTLLPDGTARRLFWDRLFDRADAFDGLDEDEAVRRILDDARTAAGTHAYGLVQLVGAGPGDPDLLTIKAHRALQQADVIFYDRLVSRDVLALARRDAELVFVGKREGNHGVGQDRINALLVEHALAGRRVVRLKSGDPLTFARAGEELTELRTAGIRTEIVPGITALTGISAATQIPVTDRAHSSSVTLVTGHTKDGSYADWADLAGKGRTLAVYMGLGGAGKMTSELILHGVAGSTPVAVVENGTRPEERRFYGTLADLPALVRDHKVKSPALLIIGDVVTLARDFPSEGTQDSADDRFDFVRHALLAVA